MGWLRSVWGRVWTQRNRAYAALFITMAVCIASIVLNLSSPPSSEQPPVAASARQLPADMLGDCRTGQKQESIVQGFCPQIAVGVDMDNSVVVNQMSWFFPGRADRVLGSEEWRPAFHNSDPRLLAGSDYDSLPGKLTLQLPPLPHTLRLVCHAFLTDYSGNTWLQEVPNCGSTFDGAVMDVPPGLRSAEFYVWDPRMYAAAAWTPMWGEKPNGAR